MSWGSAWPGAHDPQLDWADRGGRSPFFLNLASIAKAGCGAGSKVLSGTATVVSAFNEAAV